MQIRQVEPFVQPLHRLQRQHAHLVQPCRGLDQCRLGGALPRQQPQQVGHIRQLLDHRHQQLQALLFVHRARILQHHRSRRHPQLPPVGIRRHLLGALGLDCLQIHPVGQQHRSPGLHPLLLGPLHHRRADRAHPIKSPQGVALPALRQPAQPFPLQHPQLEGRIQFEILNVQPPLAPFATQTLQQQGPRSAEKGRRHRDSPHRAASAAGPAAPAGS